MSFYFPYALSEQEFKSLTESTRTEILECLRNRYSKKIEPIRDENGNIALGPSSSTGGYYATSPLGSQPLPLARTMTGGAYASISRLAHEDESSAGAAAGGGAATPPGYDYGSPKPLPRTVDWAAVRLQEEAEDRYDVVAEYRAGRSLVVGGGSNLFVGGSMGGAAGGGGPITSDDGVYDPYEDISPEIFTTAEKKLDKAIAAEEEFGITSKTNALGLEAFHYMRDNRIECYPPLYPKKKKVLRIISYTDLGY